MGRYKYYLILLIWNIISHMKTWFVDFFLMEILLKVCQKRSKKNSHEVLFSLNLWIAMECRIWDKWIALLLLLCSLSSMGRRSTITISGPWPGQGLPLGGQTWAQSTQCHQPRLPQVPCRGEILTPVPSSELVLKLT